MSDYTNKELLEAIYEVRDRVTRIEEKLNRAEKLEDKVEHALVKAQDAKDIAESALVIANLSKDEIKSMRANTKWAWGFAITLAIALIGEYIGVKIQ